METWRAEACRTLRTVDPEAFGTVRIVDRAELDDRFDGPTKHCVGMGSPFLGALLPGGSVGDVGIVTFRGRLVALCPGIDPGSVADILFHVCLHEAAHAVEAGRCAVRPHVAIGRAIVSHQRGEWDISRHLSTDTSTVDLPRWLGHGLNFIRAALHIYARAQAEGLAVNLQRMTVAGERYGLSSAEQYLAALGDEPDRLRDCNLYDLPSIPLPARFRELWTSDTLQEPAMSETKNEAPVERGVGDCSWCPVEPPGRKPEKYAASNGMVYLRCRRCRHTWTMPADQYAAAVETDAATAGT